MPSTGSLAGELGGSLGGSASSGDSAGKSPASILGSLLVEYWDSELGIALASGAVDTWTGQKLGYVVSAPGAGNRPAYGADGTSFKSHNVVQCASGKVLTSLDLGTVLASGTRPYFAWVWRQRTGVLGGRCWQLNNSNGADTQQAFFIPGATLGRQYTGGTNQDITTPSFASNSPAAFCELWLNGTSGLNFSKNGTDSTPLAAATGAMDAAVKQVNFATLGTGLTTSNENASLAWFGLLSAEPSASQRAALHAWSIGRYGTP